MPKKKKEKELTEREKLFKEIRERILEVREELKPYRGRIREHLEALLERRFGALPTPIEVIPVESRADVIEERTEYVNKIVEGLEDDIRKLAIDFIRGGIKDALYALPTERLKELSEIKLKPKLRRKKGCMFLQFGNGIKEKIEEVYLSI